MLGAAHLLAATTGRFVRSDGNQVNERYKDAAGALVELKHAVLDAGPLSEEQKLDAVADIDSIESQLAKAEPNHTAIQGAWEGLKKLNTVLGLTEKIHTVAGWLSSFL